MISIFRHLRKRKSHQPLYVISADSVLEQPVTVEENAIIKNKSKVEAYSIIQKASVINSSKLGKHTLVQPYAILNNVITASYVTIYKNAEVFNSIIGECSYVGEKSMINNLNIGRFCSIGPYLIAGRGTHPTDYISTSPVFFSTGKQCGLVLADRSYFKELGSIEIGNDVWIGAGVTIMDDIKIGHGAIVGAGAVVTKDVAPYSIVGGVPAKLIRKRFDDEVIALLLQSEWWNFDIEKLKKLLPFFQTSNVTAETIKRNFF